MQDKKGKWQPVLLYFLILVLLLPVFFPVISADTNNLPEGYTKGVSYKPVIPLKKATFIEYDEESYQDDYAYLASVPTAVFDNGDTLFSSPLLFYQKSIDSRDERKDSLDAKTGIDYFMEDWTAFCGNRLDQIIGVNVEKADIQEWSASEYKILNESNPFTLANQIALEDWSYTDNAVIAVIQEDFKNPQEKFSNNLSGTFPAQEIYELPQFELQQTNSLNPVYYEFTVEDEYKYIKAEAWWDGIFFGGTMIPPGDPDLQLYCKEDGEWMQAAAVAQWNIYSPKGHEFTYSHIYNPGPWRIGITDFPTETEAPQKSLDPAKPRCSFA